MALYVYGIVEKGALAGPPQASGIDLRFSPRLVEAGDLAAVVSEVDVAEFEGEALEFNVSTPDWLEKKVRAHESVLDEVVAAATVIPMRFGSIFSTPEGLTEMLVGNEADLRGSLERLQGRSEWGVKVHCDRRALVEHLAGASVESSSGRNYLLQKKAKLDAEAQAAAAAAAVGAEVHESLGDLADAAAVVPSRSGPAVVLNGAYLVMQEDREPFMERVEELQNRFGEAYMFVVTGPWPPYNFVTSDVSGPRS